MAYVYRSLVNPRNTSSGVAEYALLAPVSSFAVDGIKCPVAPFTAPGDEVSVKVAHQFNAGEGFIKVQLAPEKNKLDATSIGDRGFTKLDMTLEIFIPGSYAEVHEAVKNWMNKPLIVLIKDAECTDNMYYQLGCDCASSWLSVDFSTGTTKDGVKGYTGKITYQNGYIQIYVGPAPTIKGSAPVVTTFDTSLPFATSTSANAAGVTGTSGATNSNLKFEFNAIPGASELAGSMSITVGGEEELTIDFMGEYAGKPFKLTDTAGVVRTGNFTDPIVAF